MTITTELHLEELIIDPEFESVIPPLTELEFDQLRKNILEDKEVFHPIIVWNNIIIDGHNRYKILKEHKSLPFRIRKLDFSDRFEVIAWICKNQIGRRNLSDAQLTILIGRRLEAEKKSHGGDRRSAETISKRRVPCEPLIREGLLWMDGTDVTFEKDVRFRVSHKILERNNCCFRVL